MNRIGFDAAEHDVLPISEDGSVAEFARDLADRRAILLNVLLIQSTPDRNPWVDVRTKPLRDPLEHL